MSLRSFRDPDGSLTDDGVRVLRRVSPDAAERCRNFLSSGLYSALVQRGWLVPASQVDAAQDGSLAISHPRIEMPGYPCEWTPSMLCAAAELTLQIQWLAWEGGWSLKDAAASNILFDRGRPVHCDLLSFEKRQPTASGRWVAYGQFVRNFLIPLLLHRDRGWLPRDVFLSRRDGVRARDALAELRWTTRMRPAVFLHVTLPAWLEKGAAQAPAQRASSKATASPGEGADPVGWTLRSLLKLTRRLDPGRSARRSVWSHYAGERSHYQDAALKAKKSFIEEQVRTLKPRLVLDIGANSGEYSLLAADAGARVCALDEDAQALDQLSRVAAERSLPVTCLHANFARPTPGLGWRLQESLSLDDRLKGRFDMVIAVAVLHHLVVTERLPLEPLVEQLAELCNGRLVIEFVDREDPMFRELAGLNEPLYRNWSLERLLDATRPWFTLVEQQTLQALPTRTLLALQRKP